MLWPPLGLVGSMAEDQCHLACQHSTCSTFKFRLVMWQLMPSRLTTLSIALWGLPQQTCVHHWHYICIMALASCTYLSPQFNLLPLDLMTYTLPITCLFLTPNKYCNKITSKLRNQCPNCTHSGDFIHCPACIVSHLNWPGLSLGLWLIGFDAEWMR